MSAQEWIQQGFQAFPAPAKVNLFLHITGRRPDGYHQLQSVFRLIDLQDTIYLRLRTDGQIQQLTPIANTLPEQDLCLRAAQLLKQHTGIALGVDIAVQKNIPMGAGLGGGSSDAATVLIALNHLWQCHLTREQLISLGLQLGADVPFFIFGRNAWVEGIGEQLTAITLQPAYYLVLTPAVHVSTAQIFADKQLTRDTFATTIAAFSETESSLVWDGKQQQATRYHENALQFHNDLEAVVCQHYPAVQACIDWLSDYACAQMSGSGASVFAAFQHRSDANGVLEKVPAKLAGKAVFSSLALGLEQHPLYNLAD